MAQIWAHTRSIINHGNSVFNTSLAKRRIWFVKARWRCMFIFCGLIFNCIDVIRFHYVTTLAKRKSGRGVVNCARGKGILFLIVAWSNYTFLVTWIIWEPTMSCTKVEFSLSFSFVNCLIEIWELVIGFGWCTKCRRVVGGEAWWLRELMKMFWNWCVEGIMDHSWLK